MEPVSVGMITVGGFFVSWWMREMVSPHGFRSDVKEINRLDHVLEKMPKYPRIRINGNVIKGDIQHAIYEAKTPEQLDYVRHALLDNASKLDSKSFVDLRMLMSDKFNHMNFESIREMMWHMWR